MRAYPHRRGPGPSAQPAAHRAEHHERGLGRPDRPLPRPERGRGHPAHSRHLHRARHGRGTLRPHPRHRGPAQLDDHQRRAHPLAGRRRAPGGPRRDPRRPPLRDRGHEGADPGHGRGRDRRHGEPRDQGGAGEARVQATLGGGFNYLADSYDQSGRPHLSHRFADEAGPALLRQRASTGPRHRELRGGLRRRRPRDPREPPLPINRANATAERHPRLSPPGPLAPQLAGSSTTTTTTSADSRCTSVVGDGELDRQLQARQETQKIARPLRGRPPPGAPSSTTGFRSQARRRTAGLPYSTFLQEDVEFDRPTSRADFIDPDNIQANPQNEDFAEYVLDELLLDATSRTATWWPAPTAASPHERQLRGWIKAAPSTGPSRRTGTTTRSSSTRGRASSWLPRPSTDVARSSTAATASAPSSSARWRPT